MTVLITLTLAGTDVGPFDIYTNLDGFTTPVITGISKAALLAGYYATLPNGTTTVLVQSTGECTTQLYLVVDESTTTTTTSTTTTTLPPEVKIDSSYTTLCEGGGSTVGTISYTGGTTICDASSISATTFNSLAAGNYFIYRSDLGYVEYNKPGGIGTDSMDRIGGGCTSCV